jgi:small GTP-binding protein
MIHVVVTVGESSVGKSSITLRFVHNHFKENNVATIGASFLSKSIYSNGWMKFNIWDTAGQEKYRSLASLYYRGVDCAILVYDITNRNSFEAVQNYWVHELRHQCSEYGGLVLCIAGNKADLQHLRQVSQAEGQDLAREYSACKLLLLLLLLLL